MMQRRTAEQPTGSGFESPPSSISNEQKAVGPRTGSAQSSASTHGAIPHQHARRQQRYQYAAVSGLIALISFFLGQLVGTSRIISSPYQSLAEMALNLNCPAATVSRPPQQQESTTMDYRGYVPASTEDYIIKNMDKLGYNTQGRKNAPGCPIWKENSPDNPIYQDLQTLRKELVSYTDKINSFPDMDDLRPQIDKQGYDICKKVDLHPDGVKGLFPSGQLSFTSSGYVEPLFPPMRHPDFCFRGNDALMDLGYLIHDFGSMCRSLKNHSRIVLFDMGASLQYHESKNAGWNTPALFLINLFTKMGFPFDHIYAYEVTPTPPAEAFEKVPPHLMAAYHWINVGVDHTPGAKLNPFTTLLHKYNEDDLIIVKLDVDTPSIEMPLAHQVLNDERLSARIDQFYFEHHVRLDEIAKIWRSSMRGSVKDTLDLFHKLRKKGVPAHFWV